MQTQWIVQYDNIIHYLYLIIFVYDAIMNTGIFCLSCGHPGRFRRAKVARGDWDPVGWQERAIWKVGWWRKRTKTKGVYIHLYLCLCLYLCIQLLSQTIQLASRMAQARGFLFSFLRCRFESFFLCIIRDWLLCIVHPHALQPTPKEELDIAWMTAANHHCFIVTCIIESIVIYIILVVS